MIAERIGGALAIGCCVILLLFSDEPALALAGAGALVVLAWRIAPWHKGER